MNPEDKKPGAAVETWPPDSADPVALLEEAGVPERPVAQDGETDVAELIPRELSILPLRDNVLFPAVVMPMAVTRDASIKLIDDAAVAENRVIGIVSLQDPTLEASTFADVYPVGVAA